MEVVEPEHYKASQELRSLLATYNEAADLIQIGAYVGGSNAKIDESIKKIDHINSFLCQGVFEKDSFEDTTKALEEL